MSAVYIVLSCGDFCFEIECHAGFMKANERALEIARQRCPHSPIVINPPEQKIDDGIIWLYTNTVNNYIAVIFQHIQSPQTTKGFVKHGDDDKLAAPTSPMAFPCFIADGYLQGKQAPPIPADPANRELPGGWDYNGKPITMATVIDDPYCVKDYCNLTTEQMRALVIARIRKRPRYSVRSPGVGTFLQKESLTEINSNSLNGGYIMDAEINWLDNFLAELKHKN